MDITYHYPPDLMALLIEALPALCKSKRDVLLFFRGAGVSEEHTADIAQSLSAAADTVRKHAMVRTVLTRLNEKGEAALRERREVLRRVTEFESFSMCWENDRHKAMALVAEIKKLVDVKDSFTRMRDAMEEHRHKHELKAEAKAHELHARQVELASIKDDFFALFALTDPWKRGKKLEGVLNRLFQAHKMLVREAFTVRGREGEGIVEQIDGVLEIDGHLYLVEMKWWNEAIDKAAAANFLVGVYHRGHTRGILIADPGFTEAARVLCDEALQRTVVVLCLLEELVRVVDARADLKAYFKQKIQAAQIDKKPLFRPTELSPAATEAAAL